MLVSFGKMALNSQPYVKNYFPEWNKLSQAKLGIVSN